MLIQWLEPDFTFQGPQGVLKQLVRDGWKQVNVIDYVAGAKTGNHYHKFNRECFYVVKGRFKLKVWNASESEEYEMKSGDMFVILPEVYHSFEYSEDSILVALYDKGVELSETEKDIWSD
ncbi:MAG: cupin domain-containing protein [Alphaproteobacteria bacterium]|nr:cupin domain-containing protein [Alphaproteobacteria bacterium]MBO4643474.1 cupin domain-containing protein [Alphaproteobacteria bacterium]